MVLAFLAAAADASFGAPVSFGLGFGSGRFLANGLVEVGVVAVVGFVARAVVEARRAFFVVAAAFARRLPRALPTTVSVPGPGTMLLSSPVSQWTRSIEPLEAVTTPRRGPALECTDTLSPTSGMAVTYRLDDNPSIDRQTSTHNTCRPLP